MRMQRYEGGQTLVLFVLLLTVMVGFAAMAIDVGMLFEDRRELQNTADAAALAGAQELPLNPASARLKAEEWVVKHNIPAGSIKTIDVRTTSVANDTLYVELEEDFNWIFGRVLSMSDNAVGAQAAAQTGSLGPNSNLMPWSVVQGDPDCVDSSGTVTFGDTCSVKVGADSGITGWYGALDFDGTGGGSNEYQGNIVDGTVETFYCAEGDVTCPGTSTVDALHGNKVGGTDHGIEDRLSPEPTPGCSTDGDGRDDFDEVFNSGGAGQYTILCPRSPRLVVIPIVSLDGEPVQTVTIKGWSLGYLDSYACVGATNCGGSGHWEVQIIMVDAIYGQSAGFASAYNPLGGVSIIRLIQ